MSAVTRSEVRILTSEALAKRSHDSVTAVVARFEGVRETVRFAAPAPTREAVASADLDPNAIARGAPSSSPWSRNDATPLRLPASRERRLPEATFSG